MRTIDHVKHVFSHLFHDYPTLHLGHGGMLLKRGELSDSMYYITHGTVNVTGSEGEKVAQRGVGDIVGEMGLITGRPRSMDIVCASSMGCAFKKLDENDLNKLLEARPSLEHVVEGTK